MSTTTSAAVTRLNQLVSAIRQQSPKTLASWRLSHSNLVQALEEFAQNDNDNQLLDQVQTLFRDKLNPLLAEQEATVDGFTTSQNNTSDSTAQKEVSVVFGGKYSNKPASISEVLVSKLLQQSPKVITVSRSNLGDTATLLPKNLVHVAKQNLDGSPEEGVGVQEFVDVMKLAKEQQTTAKSDASQKIAFYLTLGQHKGVNPFVRNLHAAQNFCQALEQTMADQPQQQGQNWRVILTGTDATLPSTHPDGKMTIGSEEFAVPSYKIMQYNYVYAMSKLGQYYMLVHTIAKLLDRKEIVAETAPVIDKIRQRVYKAGEDGDYHPDDDAPIITMEELDKISRRIVELSAKVKDHFWIATGISICYTPLHAKPWTEAGLKTESPKGHLVEQIVRRLKNAISIEKAASCHFPPAAN